MPGDDSISKAMGVKELLMDLCAGIAWGNRQLVDSSASNVGVLVTKTAEVEADFELTYRGTTEEVGARVGVTTNFWPAVAFATEKQEIRKTSRARVVLQIVHVATEAKPTSSGSGSTGGQTTGGQTTGGQTTGGATTAEHTYHDHAKKDFDVIASAKDRKHAGELIWEAANRLDRNRDPNEDPRARGRRLKNAAAYRTAREALERGAPVKDVTQDLQVGLGIAQENPGHHTDASERRVTNIGIQKLSEFMLATDVHTARATAKAASQELTQHASQGNSRASTYAYAAAGAFQEAAKDLNTTSLAAAQTHLHISMAVIGG